jgi:poly(beta-D-mannuronate) lyase
VTFDNNLLNGDAITPIPEDEDTHNWLVVKGANTLVERNTFQNRQGLAADGITQVRGAFISVYVDSRTNSNVIQYNLFKDMLLADQSSAYAIQLGRTTGTDSGLDSLNTIQYNRFDNIDSKSRLIRVQGSSNVINNNTVINSQGMISLEDGQLNEVSYNVILPSGDDSNDGGISAAPYGHSIIGNYIAGSRTTSSERGAIYINHNINGTGNQSLTATALEISGNSIINARQPVHIGSKGCGTGPASIVNFSNNLIANGVSDIATYEGTTATNKGAVRYDCALDLASTFTGEAYYTATLYNEENGVAVDSITFDVDSVFGLDSEAELIAASNGLIKSSETIEGIGAGAEALFIIAEDDVGVDSSTEF